MRSPERPSVVLPRSRRRSPTALVISLLFHLLLVALAITPAGRKFLLGLGPDALGELGGGGRGAAGGSTARYVALPAPVRAEPAPTPPETPTVVPEVIPPPDPEQVPVELAVADTTPARQAGDSGAGAGGTGSGDGPGAGSGGGTGGGDGSGAGTGQGPGTGGGLARPPEMRHLALLPLETPKSMRGRTVQVTFWVREDGRVERVSVTPPIEDGAYAREFTDLMRSYRFRPARATDGTPVPGQWSAQWVLPTK